MTMRQYVARSLMFAIILSFSAPPLSAGAAPNRLTQCQREKIKALQSTVKKVYTCTGGELKKSGVTINTFDANCVSDVRDKFTSKWEKAIEKAAKKDVSCFNAPGPVTVADGAVTSATDVSAILRPGFAPGDNANPNAVKILNRLMKTSETYLRKTLNLHATNVAKPNLTKLASKIDRAASSLPERGEYGSFDV